MEVGKARIDLACFLLMLPKSWINMYIQTIYFTATGTRALLHLRVQFCSYSFHHTSHIDCISQCIFNEVA